MLTMNIIRASHGGNISLPTSLQMWDGTSLVEPVGVTPHEFSAGEAHLNFAPDAEVKGQSFVITIRGGTFSAVGEALVYSDALRRMGAAEVNLFSPYLPAARQDRGAPFSAKVYADAINSGGFDRVIAVDPHSEVMPNLLERFTAIDAVDIIHPDMFKGNFRGDGTFSVIAPDAGAEGRAKAVAARFGVPVVQAEKHRDPDKNFAITGYECERPTTDFAVVVDDICDGGGTFLALAKAIDMPAKNLRLWTTHGIYSKGTWELDERYEIIGCSDSLPMSDSALVVQPLQDALISTLSNDN